MSPEFHVTNMPFHRLGCGGLHVPVFSLGGWLTLGGTVVGDPVKVHFEPILSGHNIYEKGMILTGN
jgi:hypothetical protein